MEDKIIIKGAREHNLKNISLEIPRGKLIVFTGVSGSGKSSLAFDTIFAEGQRRYVESLSAYARQFLAKMDKPDVDEISGLSPAISIDQKAISHNPRSIVATATEIYDYMRVLFARVGIPYCPRCGERIEKMTIQEMVSLIFERSKKLTPKDWLTVLSPVVRSRKGEYYQLLYDLYNKGFEQVRIDGKWHKLSEKIVLSRYGVHTIEVLVDRIAIKELKATKEGTSRLQEALETALDRSKGVVTLVYMEKEETYSSRFACPNDGFSFPEIEPRLFSFNSPHGACITCHGLGVEEFGEDTPCKDCKGLRLREEPLAIKVDQKNIAETCGLTIEEASGFFKALSKKLKGAKGEIAASVLQEISNRLTFLQDVGLNYLTLDRKMGTLAGGEAQRIRLASQLGSRLTGTLYVLDEPTIGLHPSDNGKLIETLKELRDLQNTVIVVEHDQETIETSDYLVDLGPGAGKHGGELVVAGETKKLLDPKYKHNSMTLDYLTGRKKIPVPVDRRVNSRERLKVIGATHNNLQNLTLEIPLRRFVCLTGVSGSGKSSFLYDVLYRGVYNKINGTALSSGAHKDITGGEYLSRVLVIDQSPIGRTPRSNPATYVGFWGYIRDLFAETREAHARGYGASRFSFNVASVSVGGKGGRCEACQGYGFQAVEMHFLPTVWVTCDICQGKRFDSETLEVQFKGKNIYEVLKMTISEAREFFSEIYYIADKLKVLEEVGLGYLELGQTAPTLSGGEAQRIKLASELASPSRSRTLYLFDEPTVGLHFEDVRKLLEILQRLVDQGNTVMVIEHNLDVMKTADYIIDLGPGGGKFGGKLVASGTPEEIAKNPESLTGKYLRKVLH